MKMDSQQVILALSALAEHLDYLTDHELELVVCGGSALQVMGLVNRTTKDVDILAIARSKPGGTVELLSAEPLPDAVAEAARIVARDLELPDTWLNSGPTDLLNQGLPDGFVSRLHPQRYGRRLLVHFVDRFDQICFKLYATINGGPAHHLADLKLLDATEEELAAAARWCLTQDASEQFPLLVISCLEKIGYSDVAKSLETGI